MTEGEQRARRRDAAAPPAAVTVEVTQPVDHDGRRYAPGDTLTASPAAAAALLAAGAARPT